MKKRQVIKSAQPFKVEISKTQAKFQETIGATLPSTKQIGTTVKAVGVKVAPIVSTNLDYVFDASSIRFYCAWKTQAIPPPSHAK